MHSVVACGVERLVLSNLGQGLPNCFKGMSFVVTGVLPSLDREDAQTLIEQYGGQFRKSVSGKTTYLLVGSHLEDGRAVVEGSKYKAAVKKKVLIINQDEFLALCTTTTTSSTTPATISCPDCGNPSKSGLLCEDCA